MHGDDKGVGYFGEYVAFDVYVFDVGCFVPEAAFGDYFHGEDCGVGGVVVGGGG